jgi:N-glycosylase/DNA lyase
MRLPGVGPKVADCVLLFGYNFYDSIPVDVWIRKIITRGYGHLLPVTPGNKAVSYDQIADFCRRYFGQYGGYAQQYIFAGRQEMAHKLRL